MGVPEITNTGFAIAKEFGIFVALFVMLLVFVLWDSRRRENRYIAVIDQLSKRGESINIIEKKVDNIERDVHEIKIGLGGRK